VTVRSASSITVTADQNCTVEVRHCLRTIPWETAFPTWNDYDPDAPSAWAIPGGTGAGDSTYVGAVSLQANTPASMSNSNVVAAAQNIIDGAHPYFILRRTDTGPLTVNVSAEITVEFDLDAE
jgi:hypothetical protein